MNFDFRPEASIDPPYRPDNLCLMHHGSFHSAWIAPDGTVNVAGMASSLFPWWSFTKTVLSICALRLAEDGLLDLDKFWPQKNFTLRQLLQHRAGVPNYGQLKSYHDAVARHDVPWPREQLLQAVQADRLDFLPGTDWAYSNVGYMYVREAIEEVTRLDLATALQDIVLGPLNLSSVRLATRPGDFSEMYWPFIRTYDAGWVYHGCLTGTAIDAARLLHALFHGYVLSANTLQTMLERYELGGAIAGRPWTATGYGLGLMSGCMGEAGQSIGHSGGGPFCVNAVYHFPDLDVPVTVASFTEGNCEGAAETEALRLALQAQK